MSREDPILNSKKTAWKKYSKPFLTSTVYLNPFLVPCADRRVDRRPAAPVGHEPRGPDFELGENRVEEVLQVAGAAGGVD
jgi:hypothetical protein